MAAGKIEKSIPSAGAPPDEKEIPGSFSSTSEKIDTNRDEALPSTEEREYLGGVKLILVLASTTVACFLVLLDMVIIATVCLTLPSLEHTQLMTLPGRLFPKSRITSTRFQMSGGTGAHTLLQGSPITPPQTASVYPEIDKSPKCRSAALGGQIVHPHKLQSQ
jgi:hypothetical protein